MKILIVKLSAIGDVLHTLPAANALREAFPNAHITWLVEEAASDLVIGHPALDRVIISRRKRWLRDLIGPGRADALREIRDFVGRLRDTRYDIVLDFQALLKSSVLIALVRGKRKIGFGPGMEHMEYSWWFLNEKVPAVDMEIHALTRNLMMLAPLGIHKTNVRYRLPISSRQRADAVRLIPELREGGSRPLICINPVAKWDTKLWNNDRFAELADILSETRNAVIVFTGAAEDDSVIRDIQSRMRTGSHNLAGKTSLKTLAALYARAHLLITTDTGPMHLCAAVETPVVGLFGPTAPWRTGPFGERHRIVRIGASCSPCFQRSCPTRHCMETIGVDRVLEAVGGLLDEPRSSGRRG